MIRRGCPVISELSHGLIILNQMVQTLLIPAKQLLCHHHLLTQGQLSSLLNRANHIDLKSLYKIYNQHKSCIKIYI